MSYFRAAGLINVWGVLMSYGDTLRIWRAGAPCTAIYISTMIGNNFNCKWRFLLEFIPSLKKLGISSKLILLGIADVITSTSPLLLHYHHIMIRHVGIIHIIEVIFPAFYLIFFFFNVTATFHFIVNVQLSVGFFLSFFLQLVF